jgi:hypothetical protein
MSDLQKLSDMAPFFQPFIGSLKWSDLPLNGQLRRAEKISELVKALSPKAIIETGTYRGITSDFFAAVSGVKIYTIEINQEFASEAALRFHHSGSSSLIELRVGDSSVEVPKIIEELNLGRSSLFAYLDAHWNESLPLSKELRALEHLKGPCVIVIDDFQVPDFPGYGFDQYGDIKVGRDLISNDSCYKVWVPNESHLRETGARRGTAYLINKPAARILKKSFFYNLKRI